MSKTRTITRDWVKCPICGEGGMCRETEDDHVLISCTNHACGSNGGNNFLAVEEMFRPKDYESINYLADGNELMFQSMPRRQGLGHRLRSWVQWVRTWTR